MPNKVTVQDIADALGLSRNTVSKAINNTGILAEDTKNKIIQKAIEMGYKQFTYTNSTEINKKTLQTGEVALFLGSFLSTSHFATTMLDKFQHELSVIGYTLTMHRVTAEDIAQKKLPSSFNPEKTKAIACIEMFNIEYCKFITSMEIPVLMIDAPVSSIWEPLNADLLLMENTSNIYTLIKDMKERGIKEIGFIGEQQHCRSFYERYMAYRNAMYTMGLPVKAEYCITDIHSEYEHQNDYFDLLYEEKLYKHISELKTMPELFICANDFVAINFIKVTKKLNINIPEHLKLVGFDDSSESKIITPTLSTCHIHTQTIGYEAANMIISRIDNPSLDYRTTYVQTDLIYRESTN